MVTFNLSSKDSSACHMTWSFQNLPKTKNCHSKQVNLQCWNMFDVFIQNKWCIEITVTKSIVLHRLRSLAIKNALLQGGWWFGLLGHMVSHDRWVQSATAWWLPLLSMSSLPRQVLRTFARWNRHSSSVVPVRHVALTMTQVLSHLDGDPTQNRRWRHRCCVSGLGGASSSG